MECYKYVGETNIYFSISSAMTQFAELTFVQVLSLPAAEVAARTRASSPYPECSADCGQIGVTTSPPHHLPPRLASPTGAHNFHFIQFSLRLNTVLMSVLKSKRKGRREMAHSRNSNPY